MFIKNITGRIADGTATGQPKAKTNPAARPPAAKVGTVVPIGQNPRSPATAVR
jgi:hypothetical protein